MNNTYTGAHRMGALCDVQRPPRTVGNVPEPERKLTLNGVFNIMEWL